jgi:hypothetical protein
MTAAMPDVGALRGLQESLRKAWKMLFDRTLHPL